MTDEYTPPKELCCECDNPTGRAGLGEDSIYTDDGLGPFCEECWDAYTVQAVNEHEQLKARVEYLEEELRQISVLAETFTASPPLPDGKLKQVLWRIQMRANVALKGEPDDK